MHAQSGDGTFKCKSENPWASSEFMKSKVYRADLACCIEQWLNWVGKVSWDLGTI